MSADPNGLRQQPGRKPYQTVPPPRTRAGLPRFSEEDLFVLTDVRMNGFVIGGFRPGDRLNWQISAFKARVGRVVGEGETSGESVWALRVAVVQLESS